MKDLNSWLFYLSQKCEGTNYMAKINDLGDGVAIVPKNTQKPQKLCVYPKQKKGPGLVVMMDVYENPKVKKLIPTPNRIHSNRPHYNGLTDELVMQVVDIFLG